MAYRRNKTYASLSLPNRKMRHSMPNHSFQDLVVCLEARRATSRIGGNEENRNARLLLRITEIDVMMAFKFPSFQVVKYSPIKNMYFPDAFWYFYVTHCS